MATQQATGVNAVLRDIRISLSELFTGGGRLEPKEELLVEVLFGLLGVLASADSIVTSHEVEFVNALMDELHLPTRGREIALDWFERGRRRKIELQPELLRFGKTFPAGSSESARLYDALLRLAAADGRVRPREKQFLEELTLALGYTRQTLEGRLRDLGHASSP